MIKASAMHAASRNKEQYQLGATRAELRDYATATEELTDGMTVWCLEVAEKTLHAGPPT